MNCVSYTRYTACAYEAPSIEEQNNRIKEFASKNGLKLAKKYSDRKNDSRADTAFRQLSEDGIARKFDCVIFCSMFLLGPTTYVGYDLLSKTFAPCGIFFAVVEDEFLSWEHSLDEIQEYLKIRYTDYRTYIHRHDIWKASKNKVWDKFGYVIQNDGITYEIDECAAAIVREIFRRTIEGEMPTAISKDLQARGTVSPMQRFAQLNGRSTEDANGWDVQWIKRILHTRHYTGSYQRNIEGKIKEIACPVIIGREDYEAVQNIFQQRKRKQKIKTRFKNPFLNKLFDFDSRLPLVVVYNYHRDRYEYMARNQDKTRMNYEKNKWIFDDVYSQTAAALREEREKAARVLEILASEEGKKTALEIIGKAKADRQILFDKMLNVADAILPYALSDDSLEEFTSLDREFVVLSERVAELEKIFSKENPWIKRFGTDSYPEETEGEKIGEFFERILSHKFESLEFVIADAEWRNKLPEDWR